MDYQQLLNELNELSEEKYAQFNAKLLKNDKIKIIGVTIPNLRKLAKKFKSDYEVLFAFPNDFYEVRFIKLTVLSMQDYPTLLKYIDEFLPLFDCWALCDTFTPNCIKKNREDFLPYIRKCIKTDSEFIQRFALKMLFSYYLDEFYLEEIFSLIQQSNTEYYYVHMMAAWMICEVLVKYYNVGKSFLMEHLLDRKTHNKAIQKACESYRISNDEKNFLKGIKR